MLDHHQLIVPDFVVQTLALKARGWEVVVLQRLLFQHLIPFPEEDKFLLVLGKVVEEENPFLGLRVKNCEWQVNPPIHVENGFEEMPEFHGRWGNSTHTGQQSWAIHVIK